MPYRSPARFLAPLALLAAVVTVFLVARPELGGSEEQRERPAPAATTGTAEERRTPPRRQTTPAPRSASPTAKTYTVQPGDVLGAISEETGVAVADLLEYNDVDASNLRVGQKLKLVP
jgi:cell envelope opacity-associated protein A